ncbi:MAG: 7TM diverse intracellular signaling domain-containing protein [Patiriisocius sp.]|uniref:7TM diverse intracellular signaling domain-containing protein n=1 Tax=Patiriisocius sp. TaxID=2822396 RepID=UPI003EFA2BEA
MKLRKLPPALLLALFFTIAQTSATNVKTKALDTNFQQLIKVEKIDSEKQTITNSSNSTDSNTAIQVIETHPENSIQTTAISEKEIVTADSKSVVFDSCIFSSGFFYGIMSMIILINLLCFLLFSDKVFGYFALSVTTIVTLIFSTDSLIPLLFENLTSFSTQIETTLLVISTVTLSVFSSKYLNLKDSYPRLKSITLPLLIIAGLLTTISWFVKDTTVMMAASFISFTVMLAYFAAGIILFSSKNYAKFYVIASSIPLLFSIDYFLLGGMGIDFLGTQTIHIKVAVGIQMLLMTYAIVYRMQALKDELILRQTEMKIFLAREEEMSRSSLSQMMKDEYLENLIMQYDLDGIEIKLLQYISEDKTNQKIAKRFNTTVSEVEEMTKDLYRKLEISEAIEQDHRMLEAQPDYLYN